MCEGGKVKTNYDIAIIGAGPSGIMAAITAARNGRRVALIDRNAQVGRKLLATGNGRCNLANAHFSIDRYHGADPRFIASVLSRFDQHAAMGFFQNLGLLLKEEDDGRVFPRTNQASSVVEVLRQALADHGVDLLLESLVVQIEQRGKWVICLNDARTISSDKLIIATGGKAAHQFGSTGDGFHWAKKLGHSITPFHAALVPIETVEKWPGECQGLRMDASVWVTCGDDATTPSTGDVLFTDYGVSGPAVMSQASEIAVMLRTAPPVLHIDLFPDLAADELSDTVTRILNRAGTKPIADALVGMLPSGLIPVVLRLAGLSKPDLTQTIPPAARLAIPRLLKNLALTASRLRPYKEAQVTAGGVNTDEVDPDTLESRIVPSLYFAGEILDCDGDSGGFNLQWAWSSGYVAGLASSDSSR